MDIIGKKAIVLRAPKPELVGIVVTITEIDKKMWCSLDGVPLPGVWVIPRELLLVIS